MATKDIERLKKVQADQRERLQRIVREAMKEERILSEYLNHTGEPVAFGDRLADKVATFGGSWKFILTFILVIAVWIMVNVMFLTMRFDPYPFILMNLFLSCIAALQAPIIMMSQNRKEVKDRKRAENDFMVNLKAELEIRNLHQKLDLLLGDGMKAVYESQAKQIALLQEILKRLDPSSIRQDSEKPNESGATKL